MSQTAGILDANVLLIYVGATAIAHSRSFTMSESTEMKDRTTQSDANIRKIKPGRQSSQISGEGYFAMDAAYGYADLKTAKDAGTALAVSLSNENTGDTKWSGSAYVESLEMSGEEGGDVSFSFTLQIDGAITAAAISAG